MSDLDLIVKALEDQADRIDELDLSRLKITPAQAFRLFAERIREMSVAAMVPPPGLPSYAELQSKYIDLQCKLITVRELVIDVLTTDAPDHVEIKYPNWRARARAAMQEV